MDHISNGWCSNGIEVRDLSLQHGQRAGCDAWGRQKEQPLLVSVRLSLQEPFLSAAAGDALDDSTMHYGQLAKRLRNIRPASDWESLDSLARRVHAAACEESVAIKLLNSSEVRLFLPKASLLGRGVSLISRMTYASSGTSSCQVSDLCLHAVSIPTLIGVNSNEREQKQPLIFDITVYDVSETACGGYTWVEEALVKIVEPTVFETLESLLLHIVQEICAPFQDKFQDSGIRVRVEKPIAIPFAAAPAIEIYRAAAELKGVNQDQAKSKAAIRIVRPYHSG